MRPPSAGRHGRLAPIRYVDGETGQMHEEAVYGGFWLQLLYGSPPGRWLAALVAWPLLSKAYGWLQDRALSRRKIAPFIRRFGIEMADFLPEDGQPPDRPYSTFNSFFTRRVAPGVRPFASGSDFPAPCDARYFGYEALDDSVSVPVKGAFLKAEALLASPRWNQVFAGGPAFVARLCPVDYHRFHFPDDGEAVDAWRLPGALHSVNPWALAFRPDIFVANERRVTVLDTRHFGALAYVEVGATCVGRIRQTHRARTFRRGDEKGMFLFGGSTVVVIGEAGRWRIDAAIARNTRRGLETRLKMGRALGAALP